MADGHPLFYELLLDADKETYDRLRQSLAAPSIKSQPNRSVATFSSIIDCIRAFVLRGDDNDKARSLACGICFLDDAIAVNISQLGILTVKSKSSINGILKSMGYGTVPPSSDAAAVLFAYLPWLRGNHGEVRKWTVRQKVAETLTKNAASTSAGSAGTGTSAGGSIP
jgi:hypothetical protein